jgi:ankyrin repeat protein
MNKNDLTDLMKACKQNDYDHVVYQVEVLKADINKQRKDGETALASAIHNKNLKIIKYLCEHGANINLKDNVNNTALLHAIYVDSEIALYLIQKGADITIKNKLNETPMHFAAMSGDLLISKILIERGLDINISNKNNHTPIMLAACNKHIKLVKLLLENNADINGEDINNDNLMHLCILNDMYDILLLLIGNRKNTVINNRNNNGESPLLFAIKQNKLQYAKLLLKYGASLNTFDNQGNYPLLYAVEKNNLELCKLLLDNNANPNLYFTWMGYKSPLFSAINNNNNDIKELLLKYEADDLLFCYIENNNFYDFQDVIYKNKNSINTKNSNGETLLYFATSRNKIKFVNFLLENGADPNICNEKEQNQSCLYQAVLNRNYEIFNLLVNYNADYNHKLSTNESIYGKANRYCWSSQICNDLKEWNAVECCEWDY